MPRIAPETNDVDHKHDMESVQPEDIKIATTTSYTSILFAEVILKSDPRYSSPKRQESIKQEIEGLLEIKSFAFVELKRICHISNILGGRIIIAIKTPAHLLNDAKQDSFSKAIRIKKKETSSKLQK